MDKGKAVDSVYFDFSTAFDNIPKSPYHEIDDILVVNNKGGRKLARLLGLKTSYQKFRVQLVANNQCNSRVISHGDIFINDLDINGQCTPSKFMNNTKLEQ